MNILTFIILLGFQYLSDGSPLHQTSNRKSPNQSLIINGEHVHISEYPSTALLRIPKRTPKYQQTCGSTILNPRTLLSAANCIYNILPKFDDIHITIGSAQRYRGINYYTSNYTIHPSFKPGQLLYDLVAIRTRSRMYLDGVVTKAVVLAAVDSLLTDYTILTIAGWGSIVAIITYQKNDFLIAKLPVFPSSECAQRYRNFPNVTITDGLFCIGEWKTTFTTPSACEGDMGGPVYRNNKVQVGVMLQSKFCGADNRPVVCSDIRFHRDWIDRVAMAH